MSHNYSLSLGEAAYAASLADGLAVGEKRQAPQAQEQKVPLRRGKWTVEEENFALRLIEEFKLGLLPLTDGTTLRTFLSKLLNCDPMRISKKFVGDKCIGKQVFRHASGEVNGFVSAERMEKSKRELAELERKFLDRLLNSSTTPTSSTRNFQKESSGNSERKAKKTKLSAKAQDLHKIHTPSSPSSAIIESGHTSSAMSHQQPHPFSQPPHPHYGNPMHPQDQAIYNSGNNLGSGQSGRGPSPYFQNYSPYHPPVMGPGTGSLYQMPQINSQSHQQYMTLSSAGGMPYPPPVARNGSETMDEWRNMGHSRPMGPYDAQPNWNQQFLPSQQLFEQHQNQLRNTDQSDEGLLKAKGSFYKSLKSSSTSSLDLLGTLATSISRENLVSYGTSMENANTDVPPNSSSSGGGSSGNNGSAVAPSTDNTDMKRNSKSIQDFWMLVEMGDLSRPENEDIMDINSTHNVDTGVFDMEDDKSNSVANHTENATSSSRPLDSNSLHDDSTKILNHSSASNTAVSRSESAPVLSTNSHVKTEERESRNARNDNCTIPEQISSIGNKNESDVLESLLSMASGENRRTQPFPDTAEEH